jgi:hypothetical protein
MVYFVSISRIMKGIPNFRAAPGLRYFELGFHPQDHGFAQGCGRKLLKRAVDPMGFTAREITPNRDFYITTYSSDIPSRASEPS